ncbi:MAG: nuclear transport factor 2 family protein [Planctomycetota bacterium]
MDTLAVGKRLVELCKQGQNLAAIDELYADDVVTVEVGEMPGFSQRTEDKASIKAENEKWLSMHEIHGGDVKGPWPHGDRFAVMFSTDMTAKEGPMAGQRMQGDELGLYTVRDGKISHVEWFYDMSGCDD